MKLIAASLLAGGSFVAAEVVNPDRNECLAVMAEIERSDPTVMQAEGELIAVEFLVECGAKDGDDLFTLRLEVADEEMAPAVEAAATVVTYTPGAP
jgi:hypothetical protein